MSLSAGSRLVVMAAPLGVWALHFVLVYSLTGLACVEAGVTRYWLGVPAPRGALLLWTATALLMVGGMGVLAWREHRRLSAQLSTADDSARAALERKCFSARVAVLLATVAAVAIAFTIIPVFVLPDCT